MALRALNSIGGFSVGDNPQQNIILANGDITSNNITANGFANINGNLTANFANFSGNLNISNANANWGVLTDNLYYSNGSPWDMSNPAGANGYIQYYDDGSFGASANFQFTASTNTLQVTGTANVTGNLNVSDTLAGNIANFTGNLTALNANLGNLASANYVNISQTLSGNVANFSGNLKSANANLGNLVTANFANFANDIVVQGNIANANNVSITNDLQGNTANFSGNIVSLNANLGNLAIANFVNVSSNLNVTNTANVGNLNVTANVTSNLIPNVSNTYTLGNLTNMWKDLYLSGSTIYIGTQNITANGTSIAVSNDFSANNFFATNNVTANGNVYANAGGGAGYIYANFANVQSNLYVGANANIVNTLTAANIKDTNLANTQVVYANASNTLTGSSNFVFDDTSNTLSITGNANVSDTINGNIANFSGNLTSLNANLGNLASANYVNVTNQLNGNIGNFSGNVTAGNFITSGSGGNISGANVVSANSFVTQGGTANFNNTSRVNLGNIANLTIYGGNANYVMTTDGTGNVSWTETASTNSIHNGNSNVSIDQPNGNVTITANAGSAYTWTFANTNGSFNAPGDGSFVGTIGANAITSNANITANANIYANSGYVYSNYANVATDLYVGTNANIVNTLFAGTANIGNLNITSNLSTAGNITANGLTINLDASMNTANFSGNVFFNGAEANISNALYVGTNANIAGNLTVVGNIANANNISVTNNISVGSANITNLLQGANANFTGNVDAVNFIGNLANGSSNVRIDTGGNITFSPGTGYANAVTISTGGIETIGYVTANGNITTNTGLVSNTLTGFADTGVTINTGTNSDPANISLNITLAPTGNGTVSVSGKKITSLATPTADTDAATKAYVDSVAQGLNIKASVYVATYAALPAYTYNNGTAGVGATITANANGALVVDGQTISTVGTRVLVKNETAGNAPYNGIYTLTTIGDGSTPFVLTRSLDMNVAAEFDGAFTFVSVGTHNADTGWVQTGEIVTVGTTPVVWTQFSGAGQYSANTSAGLLLTGTVFSAKVDGNTNPTTAFDGNGNIYVPANAAFTTPNIGAATGTSVDLTGNVLAGNINSNAMITTANLEVSANILTNYITANVDANIIGNLTANNATVTNDLVVSGNANITLNVNGNVANFTGNLTAANANLGNLATANYVNVVTQLNGNVANFTGNLTAANANLGNLVEANYVNVANDLSVLGTANIANLSITGNITGVNNISVTNNISANSANIGNTSIQWANVTTTSTSANQIIASFTISATDIVGIEYLVKSYDATPGDTKYSVATVQAVTNGADADYAVFGTVRLGNTTGSLGVMMEIVGPPMNIAKVNLVTTPATANSTVWTTQYRLI